MVSKHLSIYLNDHLAGSVTAIELLGYIATSYAKKEAGPVATLLRDEVIEDRKVLEDLMTRLGVAESAIRKTSAWLAEKSAQLKLRVDDPAGGSFRLLEAVEAVSLGVEGKRLLWLSLATAADEAAELQGLDYPGLLRRAEHQRSRLEKIRIAAIRGSLVS